MNGPANSFPPPERGRTSRDSGSGGDRFNRTPAKTQRARELRRNGTKPEAKLWYALRDSRLGVSFRRQHPIGPYVLDRYCPALKLAIELDGDQHSEQQGYDQRRTRFLNLRDIRVIRFWNIEVNEEIDRVYEQIAHLVAAMTPTRNASRSDLPLSGGGKEHADPQP